MSIKYCHNHAESLFFSFVSNAQFFHSASQHPPPLEIREGGAAGERDRPVPDSCPERVRPDFSLGLAGRKMKVSQQRLQMKRADRSVRGNNWFSSGPADRGVILTTLINHHDPDDHCLCSHVLKMI
jgi:hypothetical protein